MKDGQQNISHDRILMRVKDYLTILGILFTWSFGTFFGMRYIIRLIDRVAYLEQRQAIMESEFTNFKRDK